MTISDVLVRALDLAHLGTWAVAFALFFYIPFHLRKSCNPRPLLWLCLMSVVVFYTFSFAKHCILTFLENVVAKRPLCTPWRNPIDRVRILWGGWAPPMPHPDVKVRCRRSGDAWIDMSANGSLIVIVLLCIYLWKCPWQENN